MKPVVLLILDGVGHRRSRVFNALYRAKTPTIDACSRKHPHHLIEAAGRAVGLPKGYQGNSEVGHLTIGAGRILRQSLERINHEIKDKSFFENKAFIKAIENCKSNDSALHLLGLVQDQGVHAHQEHLYALLNLCAQHQLKKVYIHFFTDGRDSPTKASLQYLKKLESKIRKFKVGEIKTVCGRYYAMDRDKRWQRTELAFKAIDSGQGEVFQSAQAAIKSAHNLKETDEFIKPKIIGEYEGVKQNDSIIFFNYRFDRARQLTHAFLDKSFKEFDRKKKKIMYVCMTEYYKDVPAEVAFEPYRCANLLGEVVSKHKILQLRVAETEKYAHVTYFFNGEREKPFPGEERTLIPSAKVATYDLKPEMGAYEITEAVVKSLKQKKHGLIVCNLANGDMVGHTGVFKATVRALEVMDECIRDIRDAVYEQEGVLLVTADHGNCEEMTGKHQTTHTINQVNFCVMSNRSELENIRIKSGGLADVAPTVLDVLKIEQPKEMTGKSLIQWPSKN